MSSELKKPFSESSLRIFLIRHGETEWNRLRRFQGQTDIDLNERGRVQVDSIALALKDIHLEAIYSSPLRRAMETAMAINRYHQLDIEKREGLMEMNIGEFEGLDPNLLREKETEFLRLWLKEPSSLRMPKGESLIEVQERAWKVIEEIVETHPFGSVVVCGHNFVNITIICRVLGLELDLFRRIRQSTGAINIIERSRGQFSIISLNDTCHLKDIDGL
jgi:broad specificity phosphatase PhoE